MRAGRLRHLVTIQQQTGTIDDYGHPTASWETLDQVWASIEPLSGDERLTLDIEGQAVNVKILARNLSTVTPDMRVTWNGHTYDIRAVIRPYERGIEMELLCEEQL